MPAVYQFLGRHEVLIYILLCLAAMFGFRWLWRSWNEWRHAVYGLEKEFALRRIGQSMASLALILVLFLAEMVAATFAVPNLPASMLVPTPEPDFLATPTGTISAEVATASAMTPQSAAQAPNGEGCRAGSVFISAPRSGQEVRGTVEIRGTVNIPELGFYKYEVSPAGSDTWATIAAGREAVVDGSLGQWDSSSLPPGDYQLRLVVSDTQGRALPPCGIAVRVSPQS